jgi:hypothetical protein
MEMAVTDNFPDQSVVKRQAMLILADEIDFMTGAECRDLLLDRSDRALIIEALRSTASMVTSQTCASGLPIDVKGAPDHG